MSNLKHLRFDNGVSFGLGVQVQNEMDLIINVNDISKLDDKTLAEMIRIAVPHAARAYAMELLEQWDGYFRHVPVEAILGYMEELEAHLGTSAEVDQAYEKLSGLFLKTKAKNAPAKQPRRGFIYLAYCETGQYKIGKSVEPAGRIKVFATKMPVDISLVHVFESDDMATAEKELHRHYANYRHSGEWFNLPPDDVEKIKTIACYRQGQWLFE